jgi:hypothetical protein
LSAEPASIASEQDELQAAMRYTPFAEYDVSLSLELDPQVPRGSEEDAAAVAGGAPGAGEYDPVSISITHLFFGGSAMLPEPLAIQPWESGEAPIVNVPTVTAPVVTAALPTATQPNVPDVMVPSSKEGVTVAGKGVVTGEGRGPKSPAQYLELNAKARTKAERCLSNAIYFEARSEPVRGQIAVAQVVLNRALSGFYPDDVCGVVYQGANRHLSCQFTFACDGIPDVVTEPEHWQRAKRIAREALDGKLWLKEVGKSTHYHAAYVYPYWVRSMRRLTRIGLHSFYRPRAWGNGADEPTWGVVVTADAAAKL